jgi:hypothetical protein
VSSYLLILSFSSSIIVRCNNTSHILTYSCLHTRPIILSEGGGGGGGGGYGNDRRGGGGGGGGW